VQLRVTVWFTFYRNFEHFLHGILSDYALRDGRKYRLIASTKGLLIVRNHKWFIYIAWWRECPQSASAHWTRRRGSVGSEGFDSILSAVFGPQFLEAEFSAELKQPQDEGEHSFDKVMESMKHISTSFPNISP
jgi:hypothetical protein